MQEANPDGGVRPRFYKMSASQIGEFMGCERKWAFKYVAKIRPDAHPSAALGTEVHGILEQYMRDGKSWEYTNPEGTRRKAAYIAAKALDYLPPPGTAIPEQAFDFDTSRTGDDSPGRPIWWNGYRDLVIPPKAGRLTVVDYKTTSDFRWAKTPEDLEYDPQSVIYATTTMAEHEAQEIDLLWLYLRTQGAPQAQPVRLTMTKAHAKTQFRRLEVLARDIEETHSRTTDPLQLEPDARMCRAYGGCPFQSRCNLSLVQQRQALFGAPKMSFIEELKKREALKASTAPVTVPVAEAPAAPPVIPGVTFGPSWTAAPVIPPSVYGPVNPPESVQRVEISPIVFPDTTFQTTLPDGNVLRTTPEGSEILSVQQIQEEKPKRTRRTKAQMAEAEAVKQTISVAPGVTAEDVVTSVKESLNELFTPNGNLLVYPAAETVCAALDAEEGPRPIVLEGYTLYVDCLPNREVLFADMYIAEAKVQINTLFNIADYRELKFGEGQGKLATLTAALVAQAAPSELYVNTASPEGSTVLSGLVSQAREVVRGIR